MRMLLKFAFDTQAASEAIRTGAMADINKGLFESTRPEAAYFSSAPRAALRGRCAA
jgi:hypothetical protein